MSVLLVRVLWYRIDDAQSQDNVVTYLAPVDITDAISWNAGRGLDINNNVLSIELRNDWSKYVSTVTGINKFKEEDQIKVYLNYSEDTDDITAAWTVESTTYPTSSDLIGVYYVKEFGGRGTSSGIRIRLSCVDKTYVLFNRVWSQVYDVGDGYNAPKLVQKIIRHTSENVAGQFEGTGEDIGVFYDIDAKLESEGGNITDERSDGSPFPPKGIAKIWKPVYEWIRELSDVTAINKDLEITNEDYLYGRPFIFYVDEDNSFHWFTPSFDNPTAIELGVDNIFNVNLTKQMYGTANMIIYNAGENLDGRGIWGYYLYEGSNIKGLQMKVVPMTDIARDALEADYGVGYNPSSTRETGGDPGSEAGTPFPQYPLDGSYPLTDCYFTGTYLQDYDEASDVTDDSDYRAALKEYCNYKAKERSKSICMGLAHVKWKGTIELKGTKYTPGDLIKYTDDRIGLNEEELRIVGVRHNITKIGWFTTLNLEKDPETLIS